MSFAVHLIFLGMLTRNTSSLLTKSQRYINCCKVKIVQIAQGEVRRVLFLKITVPGKLGVVPNWNHRCVMQTMAYDSQARPIGASMSFPLFWPKNEKYLRARQIVTGLLTGVSPFCLTCGKHVQSFSWTGPMLRTVQTNKTDEQKCLNLAPWTHLNHSY